MATGLGRRMNRNGRSTLLGCTILYREREQRRNTIMLEESPVGLHPCISEALRCPHLCFSARISTVTRIVKVVVEEEEL